VPAKVTDDGDGPRFFGILEISGHAPRMLEPGISLEHAVYLRAGDVVIALLGEGGLGATALVDDRSEGAVLARECGALRVGALTLLPSWLYAWTYQQRLEAEIDRLEVALRSTSDLIHDLSNLRDAEIDLAIANVL
jgi:hypothetical protein